MTFLTVGMCVSWRETWWFGLGDKSSSWRMVFLFYILFFILFYFFVFLVAYGGSQARGGIRSCSHRPTPQPQQRRILNPLIEARDGTCVLMDPSRVRHCCALMGTPWRMIFKSPGRSFCPFHCQIHGTLGVAGGRRLLVPQMNLMVFLLGRACSD